MRNEDGDAFAAIVETLCTAYNRPRTDDLVRVYWAALKPLHIHDLKRSADAWIRNARKFPTPRDLMPEKSAAPPPKPRDNGPEMSSWAIAANKILFAVAYQGNRGFRPVGALMPALLKAKADFVRMAEQASGDGEHWDPVEFNRMCREGFEKLLGTEGQTASRSA